jgi:hypothetical protein
VTEAGATAGPLALEILGADAWQMVAGERAVLEGLLNQQRPALAIEIGTAGGGSLRCIARHAQEVHSFDLEHPAQLESLDNVTLHTGDSHRLLAPVLADFERAGRNVDFVLMDGDHGTAAVAAEMTVLLSSGALRSTLILAHDAANEEVRAGLEQVDYSAFGKVAMVELDLVAGHLSREGTFAGQLWGGFGLVVVLEPVAGPPMTGRADLHSPFELFQLAREQLSRG